MVMRASLAIDSGDVIGESPLWDAERERFLWLDNSAGILHAAEADGRGGWREGDRRDFGRWTGAALLRSSGGYALASGTDILLLSPDGALTPFASIDADPKLVMFNDAKCDPQGRLWAGTHCTHGTPLTPELCGLYRIDPNGDVTRLLGDVGVSNGLDWSPDGKTFYYIDSVTRRVDAFDFDAASGLIANRRPVVTISFGDGAPDGMTVDGEGCLWVAIFGKGQVRRYSPDGLLLGCVEISAPTVTSCVFGGPARDILFITSAAIRIPDEVLPIIGFTPEMAEAAFAAPGLGGVFTCRPGVTGRLPNLFMG